jgi:hemoglobin
MTRTSILLAAALCTTVGCAQLSGQAEAPKATVAKAAASKASLYERLGGDKRINGYFAKADLPNLKRQLVDQVCQATGGPCTYTGRDMKTAHKGMKVTGAAFNALVEDLIQALDTFNVPEQEKNELLGALGPMSKDIVEIP